MLQAFNLVNHKTMVASIAHDQSPMKITHTLRRTSISSIEQATNVIRNITNIAPVLETLTPEERRTAILQIQASLQALRVYQTAREKIGDIAEVIRVEANLNPYLPGIESFSFTDVLNAFPHTIAAMTTLGLSSIDSDNIPAYKSVSERVLIGALTSFTYLVSLADISAESELAHRYIGQVRRAVSKILNTYSPQNEEQQLLIDNLIGLVDNLYFIPGQTVLPPKNVLKYLNESIVSSGFGDKLNNGIAEIDARLQLSQSDVRRSEENPGQAYWERILPRAFVEN
jgi:hypothetical protein